MTPLALSRQQLALIKVGAEQLPPEWRARYRAAIADALYPLAQITDKDVALAVEAALKANELTPIGRNLSPTLRDHNLTLGPTPWFGFISSKRAPQAWSHK